MKKKPISWTSSEMQVLDLIIRNRSKFVNACVNFMQVHRLYSFRVTTGWQTEVFVRYARTNPTYGDHLIAIGTGLHTSYICNDIWQGTGGRLGIKGWANGDTVDFFEKLHQKYWKRIERRFKKIRNTVGERRTKFRYNSFTEDLKELLARGFIHHKDTEWDADDAGDNPFIINHSDLNLVWPKLFYAESSAKDFLEKWGIPGCTINKL